MPKISGRIFDQQGNPLSRVAIKFAGAPSEKGIYGPTFSIMYDPAVFRGGISFATATGLSLMVTNCPMTGKDLVIDAYLRTGDYVVNWNELATGGQAGVDPGSQQGGGGGSGNGTGGGASKKFPWLLVILAVGAFLVFGGWRKVKGWLKL